MKKTYLTIVTTLFISTFVHAQQWTTTGNNMSNANAGNVGIGTTSLSAKFTIFQNAQLGTAAGNSQLLSATGGLAGNNFRNNIWLIRNTAGTEWTSARLHDGISIDNVYFTPQTDTRTWWERDAYNDIQSWGTSANTYVTIDHGNVGIGGIANPGYKFYVNSQNNNNSASVLFHGKYYGSSISTEQTSAPYYALDVRGGATPSGGSGNSLLYVRADGNVSIGTTDGRGYKLAVNGNVIATSMTVKLYPNWPDYVFQKDYRLPPLTEVKTYIDQHQHLPEVPSAQEVAKDGLNLGEMNKLLLKKVEELTLYLIEKDAESEAQRKINHTLQDQIDQLKKQLTTPPQYQQ